ncbi:MAG: hypothetical protein ACUVXA_14090 [Candidatus Jordarchaeum sp.]|uniref:hypothetical protein n=1 Tax=Candidatus Jordarchaeum sp. TaxID=2823881 RepID=UPI004049302A
MMGKLIAFKVYRNNDQRTTNRFCQKFYGQDVTSHGGRYRSRKHGLLEEVPHVKLIRSVIIVAEDDAKRVVDFLKEYNAEIHVREVVLTPSDEQTLKKRN